MISKFLMRRRFTCPSTLAAGMLCGVALGVRAEPSPGEESPRAIKQESGDGNTAPPVNLVTEPRPANKSRHRWTSSPAEFRSGSPLLKGTVFIPDGTFDGPGVVILGGSERGPRTRWKVELAEHLAGAGFAALIYDSAGTGESTGNAVLQTRGDRAEEARAAARCLRSQARIAANQVGILGMSEGALVAMLAAARDDTLAFAIPVSGGFGVSMIELARYRIEVKGLARGLSSDQIQQALLLEELLFALMVGPEQFEWRLIELKAAQRSGGDWNELISIVKTARQAASPDEQEQKLDALRRVIRSFRSEPWFDLAVVDVDRFDRFMTMSTPQVYAYLEKGPLASGDFDKVHGEVEQCPQVSCPVLAVWGEQDDFLPPHRSAAFLKNCLSRGGHTDATFQIVPNASHVLTRGGEDDRFAEEFLDLLTEWLSRRVAPTPPKDN